VWIVRIATHLVIPAVEPKGKVLNNKFDELAKGMTQSVTRRGAPKKFGRGILGVALATLGLATT
jgi:hypothetical protein